MEQRKELMPKVRLCVGIKRYHHVQNDVRQTTKQPHLSVNV